VAELGKAGSLLSIGNGDFGRLVIVGALDVGAGRLMVVTLLREIAC